MTSCLYKGWARIGFLSILGDVRMSCLYTGWARTDLSGWGFSVTEILGVVLPLQRLG